MRIPRSFQEMLFNIGLTNQYWLPIASRRYYVWQVILGLGNQNCIEVPHQNIGTFGLALLYYFTEKGKNMLERLKYILFFGIYHTGFEAGRKEREDKICELEERIRALEENIFMVASMNLSLPYRIPDHKKDGVIKL